MNIKHNFDQIAIAMSNMEVTEDAIDFLRDIAFICNSLSNVISESIYSESDMQFEYEATLEDCIQSTNKYLFSDIKM